MQVHWDITLDIMFAGPPPCLAGTNTFGAAMFAMVIFGRIQGIILE